MPLASQIARQRRGPAIIQQRTRAAVMVDRPAPIAGWNARDILSEMEPIYARQMDNLFPGFGKVSLRRGFIEHASGVGSGAVDTVLVFDDGAVEWLIACSPTEIYDATAIGAASSLLAGQTSGRWQGTMMNGRLAMVNGADDPVQIDNVPSASALPISGVTGSLLSGVLAHKARSYFWTGNDQSFWYSAINTLGGALTEFNLARVLNLGGAVVQCLTWTRDGGAGPDDYFVALTSAGEAVIYAGTDPGAADSWSLVGVYRIGEPLGVRSAVKVGGDVVIATRSGYQSLARAAAEPGGRVDNTIVDAVTSQTKLTGNQFGWQALLYEPGNMLIFNYPRTSSGQYGQHILNIETGAWCRFLGQNGGSWAIFNGKPYFGGQGGRVFAADTGKSDNGTSINWELITAWDRLDVRGRKKHLKMIRPVVTADGRFTFELDVARDFLRHQGGSGQIELGSGEGGTQWNSAKWNTFQWKGSAGTIDAPWVIRERVGFTFSLRLKGETLNKTIDFNSFGYAFQPGALL